MPIMLLWDGHHSKGNKCVQTEELAHSMNAVRPKPHVQNVIQKNCCYVFLHELKLPKLLW